MSIINEFPPDIRDKNRDCQMEYIQLSLFEDPLDIKVKNELKKLKDSNDRSRKCQFAKIGEVRKWCVDLEERLAIIERGLCRNSLQIASNYDIFLEEKPKVKHEKTFFFPHMPNSSIRMQLFNQPSAY